MLLSGWEGSDRVSDSTSFIRLASFIAGCTGVVTTIALGSGLTFALLAFCLDAWADVCGAFPSLSEDEMDANIRAKASDAVWSWDAAPDAGSTKVGGGAAIAGSEEITHSKHAPVGPTPRCLFHKKLQADVLAGTSRK